MKNIQKLAFKQITLIIGFFVCFILNIALADNSIDTQLSNQSESGIVFIVEIDIFSGVPNPCYIITEEEIISQIVNKLKQFKKSQEDNSLGKESDFLYPNKLGYCGLIVRTVSESLNVPKRFIVYNNTIMIGKNTEVIYPLYNVKSAKKYENEVDFLIDEDSELEKLLLSVVKNGQVVENFLKTEKSKSLFVKLNPQDSNHMKRRMNEDYWTEILERLPEKLIKD